MWQVKRVKNMKNNRGFTMLEVMIAIAILSIAIMGIVSSMLTSGQALARFNEMRNARNAVSNTLGNSPRLSEKG